MPGPRARPNTRVRRKKANPTHIHCGEGNCMCNQFVKSRWSDLRCGSCFHYKSSHDAKPKPKLRRGMSMFVPGHRGIRAEKSSGGQPSPESAPSPYASPTASSARKKRSSIQGTEHLVPPVRRPRSMTYHTIVDSKAPYSPRAEDEHNDHHYFQQLPPHLKYWIAKTSGHLPPPPLPDRKKKKSRRRGHAKTPSRTALEARQGGARGGSSRKKKKSTKSKATPPKKQPPPLEALIEDAVSAKEDDTGQEHLALSQDAVAAGIKFRPNGIQVKGVLAREPGNSAEAGDGTGKTVDDRKTDDKQQTETDSSNTPAATLVIDTDRASGAQDDQLSRVLQSNSILVSLDLTWNAVGPDGIPLKELQDSLKLQSALTSLNMENQDDSLKLGGTISLSHSMEGSKLQFCWNRPPNAPLKEDSSQPPADAEQPDQAEPDSDPVSSQEDEAAAAADIDGTASQPESQAEVAVPEDKRPFTRFSCQSQKGFVVGMDKANQDSHCSKLDLHGVQRRALFSVMDGHGPQGEKVSQYLATHLLELISDHPLLLTQPIVAIKQAFAECDRLLQLEEDINCTYSGSTCVLVYLDGDVLYCANTGDSRAVLGKQMDVWESAAFPLSCDHKPSRPDEKLRLEAAGARVEPKKGVEGAIGDDRVWLQDQDIPGLAVARAFGDQLAQTVGVIADPDVWARPLEANDAFVILASDGVWEFVTNEEAVDIVSEADTRKDACDNLLEECNKRWADEDWESRDDISFQIVYFLEHNEDKKARAERKDGADSTLGTSRRRTLLLDGALLDAPDRSASEDEGDEGDGDD